MVRIPKKKGGIFKHFSGKMCRLFKMIQASSIRRKAYVRDRFIRKHYINMDMASKSGINTFFFYSTSWKVEYAAIIQNHSKEFNHFKK